MSLSKSIETFARNQFLVGFQFLDNISLTVNSRTGAQIYNSNPVVELPNPLSIELHANPWILFQKFQRQPCMQLQNSLYYSLLHSTHTAESRHLSPPFHPFAHKPPDQLRRLLRLPLRTSHPQGSVERGHARLRSGQRGQLVLVRTALGRRTATVAGHGRRCRQMMMVVVVVKVVIVQTQLTEPMMMMRMLVKVVVIVDGCSSGSQINGWGYLLGLQLQLCRVLYYIMLLRWLLLLLL